MGVAGELGRAAANCDTGPMSLVEVAVAEGVATLTLNHPAERNTLTAAMVADILAAMDEIESDERIGAIVVTGAPPAFCAGANLGNLREATGESLGAIYAGFLRIADSPLPTIAAVNGAAVGAGMNLALGCDVRLAARRARFDTRFLQLGLHPGGGHTWMFRRIAGPQTTLAAVVFGEVLDGPEAERLGLVHRCVPDDELAAAAQAMAARAASAPPRVGDRGEGDDPGDGRGRRASGGGRPRARAAAVECAAAVVRRAARRGAGEDQLPAELAAVRAASSRDQSVPRHDGRRRSRKAAMPSRPSALSKRSSDSCCIRRKSSA